MITGLIILSASLGAACIVLGLFAVNLERQASKHIAFASAQERAISQLVSMNHTLRAEVDILEAKLSDA